MDDIRDQPILEAATSVFLRYGFKRTTMGDLAQAAGLSRPALYLRFCNKERLFEAVCRRFTQQILEEIRVGLPAEGTPEARLRLAFDRWVVRPFLLMVDHPDARDLSDCSFSFAREVVEEGYAGFEAVLRDILATLPSAAGKPPLDPAETARFLAASARGFKAAARDGDELRGMIDGLLKVVLAALR